MATQTAAALPDLDMSTSVPIQAPAAQSSALPDLDMSTSVPLNQQTSAASVSPDQTPGLDRAWSAVKTETAPLVDVAKSVVTPPQDHKEQIAHAVGGLPALQTYRA